MSAFVALVVMGASASLSFAETPPSEAETQRAHGAALYAYHCAVCHGPTGLGLAEAREAFPEDHRRCERCHKPNNPAQMTLEQMAPNDAFSIGHPSALRGEGALLAYPDAAVLFHYLRATMPRPEPGRLGDEDYWAITAFVLELGGHLAEDTLLDEVAATHVALGRD